MNSHRSMKSESEYGIEDIELLITDKQKFEDFVYTPVNEAISELKERRKDPVLAEKIHELLNGDIPEPLCSPELRAVIFRQIATPNYEMRRFVHIIEALDDLTPLFGEYRDDKFTSNNEYKHSWGRILFHKKHGASLESVKIIDLVAADGEKISEIKTLWGQSLIEFHHELIEKTYLSINPSFFFDISPWLKRHGGSAKDYYKQVMLWFVRDGILFENFMPGETKESLFTREIFLPSFIEACKVSGCRPLIVNLLPTSIENERFWLSHPSETKNYVEEKLRKAL